MNGSRASNASSSPPAAAAGGRRRAMRRPPGARPWSARARKPRRTAAGPDPARPRSGPGLVHGAERRLQVEHLGLPADPRRHRVVHTAQGLQGEAGASAMVQVRSFPAAGRARSAAPATPGPVRRCVWPAPDHAPVRVEDHEVGVGQLQLAVELADLAGEDPARAAISAAPVADQAAAEEGQREGPRWSVMVASSRDFWPTGRGREHRVSTTSASTATSSPGRARTGHSARCRRSSAGARAASGRPTVRIFSGSNALAVLAPTTFSSRLFSRRNISVRQGDGASRRVTRAPSAAGSAAGRHPPSRSRRPATRPGPARPAAPAARLGVGPGHQGQQFAAADSSRRPPPGDLGHRVADLDEVALTMPEHVPGSQRPAIVIAAPSATVTAPCRACPAAVLMATTAESKSAARLVHRQRGQALHLGDGRDDGDPAIRRAAPPPAGRPGRDSPCRWAG